MKKIAILLFTIFLSARIEAQEINKTDTVELARSLAYAQHFGAADSLLTAFTVTKDDLNAFRLHAQVLYWMEAFNRSAQILERAVLAFPDAAELNLDYGRLLYNTGHINKAEVYLTKYRAADSVHTETKLMLAHIFFWQGRFKQASKLTEQILQVYPDQKEAIDLRNEIQFNRSVYVTGSAAINSDDQPLTSRPLAFEIGAYRSSLFAPKLKFHTQQFTSGKQTSSSWWLQIGNTFSSGKAGISLSLTGGLFHASTAANTVFTGEAILAKKLGRYVTLDAAVSSKPYQYTIVTANDPLLQTVYSSSLQLNKNDKWTGKAAYELQHFPDGNNIYTAYAWLSVPLLHKQKFWLNSGYSFACQTADINRATYQEPLPPLADIYNNGTTIKTVYNPYFTPNRQLVNSLLLSTKIFFSPKVAFAMRGSIGFAAQADVPYFYVQYRPPQYRLLQEFTSYTFHPADFFAGFELRPSKQLFLQFNYQYQSLLFYKLHQAAIRVNYYFYHEKK